MTEEIDALLGHIRTSAKVNTSFGARALTPQDYPHVQVVPDGQIAVSNNRETMASVQLTVSVKVIGSRENERDTLAVFGRIIQALNTFHQSKGHQLSGEGTQEYGTDTFTITLPYIIKAII